MSSFEDVKARVIATFRDTDDFVTKEMSDKEVLDYAFNFITAQEIVEAYGADMDTWGPETKDLFMYIITRNTANLFKDEA